MPISTERMEAAQRHSTQIAHEVAARTHDDCFALAKLVAKIRVFGRDGSHRYLAALLRGKKKEIEMASRGPLRI
jgi:hypothetical protein